MPVIITPNGLTPPIDSAKIAPADGDFVDGASIQGTVQPIWNEIAAIEIGNKHISAIDAGYVACTTLQVNGNGTVTGDLTAAVLHTGSGATTIGGNIATTGSVTATGAGSFGGLVSCSGVVTGDVNCSGNGAFTGSLVVTGVISTGAHFVGVRDAYIGGGSDANVTIASSVEYDLLVASISANRTWKLANGARLGQTRTIVNNSVSRTLSIQDISSNPLADLISSNPPGSAPSAWRWATFVWNGSNWIVGPAGH